MMRIGFAGTPDFACTILAALLKEQGTKQAEAAQFEVVVVYTQPDRPAGRKRLLKSSPVKKLALCQSIPVQTPQTLKAEGAQTKFRDYHLDMLVVAAYGLILPPAVLVMPRLGCINVHASLLPRWRGAAPIERCLMAGDKKTGVSIMGMDAGMDTGPVFLKKSLPLTSKSTGGQVHDALALLGAQALLECMAEINTLTPIAQDNSRATFAPKLRTRDSHIDWRDSAQQIDAQIRALAYRAPAYTQLSGERVRILKACVGADPQDGEQTPGQLLQVDPHKIRVACGQGELELTLIGLSRGKGKPLDTQALHNGYGDFLNTGMLFNAISGVPSRE